MSISNEILGQPGRDNAVFATVNTGQSRHRLLFDCGEGCLNRVSRSDIQMVETALPTDDFAGQRRVDPERVPALDPLIPAGPHVLGHVQLDLHHRPDRPSLEAIDPTPVDHSPTNISAPYSLRKMKGAGSGT